MASSWNDNPTVKRWVIIGGAFLLALLLLATCIGTGKPASAATLDTVPPPLSFTAKGTPTTLTAYTLGQCWYWQGVWEVDDYLGKVQYRFAVDTTWCANAKATKVVTLPEKFCWDAGGYYTFDGCGVKAGSLGYSSLAMYAHWKYHLLVNSILSTRTPSVRYTLYPNGGVVGTVYYDN